MKVKVSSAAVDAYAVNGGRLVAEVNLRLQSHPDRRALIGPNAITTMEMNHLHHHRTMTTVFRFGAWSILDGVVPWVYRTYLARGFSERYFLAEFAAWKLALAQCLPLQLSTELAEAYDWFESQHEAHLAQARAWVPPPMRIAEDWKPRFDDLVDRMVHGDVEVVLRMADGQIGSVYALLDFYFRALGPALHEVGRRWEYGTLSVAREHLATSVAQRALTYWYRLILEQKQTRGLAIATTGPNEHHGLGVTMLADALAADGWQVRQLGCDVPTEDLLSFFRETSPDLLVISVTMPFNLLQTRDLLERIRQQPDGSRCRILVGGQAFEFAPELGQLLGADGYAPTAEAGVAMARA